LSRLPWKHFIAIPLLAILYFYGLTRVGLLNEDEPRYASIGREMAGTGDLITPRLWGEPWFEKPALLYWLIASGYRSGLQDEAGARLPVALISAGFLFLFFHRLRREFGQKAALYASAVLATSAGWLAYSHVAVTDLPLAATFGGAILLFLPWVRSGGRRGLVVGGLLLGLAVLAKGLVPLVLAIPVVWIARRRWVDLLMMAGACTAVAAPWYVLCYAQNGQMFIDELILKHHLGRFMSDELRHVQPWWYFVPVLAGLLFPWTPALALLLRREEYQDKRKLLLGMVALFGLVFFSASTNKLPGYILPILPPIAALIGIRLAEASRIQWVLAMSAILLTLAPVAAAVLPVALLEGLSRSPVASSMTIAVPSLILFAMLAAVCWKLETSGRRSLALGLLFGATAACVTGIKIFTFPELDKTASARPLWRDMLAAGRTDCAPEVPRSIRYGLNFYAGQSLPECSSSRQRPVSH
jgi:4-amino-4-deoxy-L-arabinose transferase-like glycosyltransferase